jgi:hypothetical protein
MPTDPYERLANAIVLQAVKDYRNALRRLQINPDSRSAKADKDELERFFRSQWYECLTSIDGEMLIEKLQEEVES